MDQPGTVEAGYNIRTQMYQVDKHVKLVIIYHLMLNFHCNKNITSSEQIIRFLGFKNNNC